MEFKELESFIALAHCKSFSKAATTNFVSQPTISNHIQLLEKELKAILIDRSSKQIQLTPAGETFLVHAKRILNEKNLAFSALDEYKGKLLGQLRIASSTIPGKYFLPEMLSKFSVLHPSTSFQVIQSDTEGVHRMLKNMELDFGITGAILDAKNYDYQKIIGDKLVLIGPISFGEDKISYDELLKHKFILRESGSGTRKVFLEYLASNKASLKALNTVAEVGNNDMIIDLVSLNMGLSVISEKLLTEANSKKIKIIQLDDFNITRDFYFVSRKSHSLLPLSIAFRSFVMEEIKKHLI